MSDPIRIANCSGFFGDRPSGAIEMVEGGPIDVLTGDWLAELTMLILGRIKAAQAAKGRDGQGFARTFVAQMEQVMGTCLDRGISVVSNAGGLDPDGCAEAVAEVADRLGLSPTIAYVDGDDLTPRLAALIDAGDLRAFDDGTGAGLPDADAILTANAYLGCWGIVDALERGADGHPGDDGRGIAVLDGGQHLRALGQPHDHHRVGRGPRQVVPRGPADDRGDHDGGLPGDVGPAQLRAVAARAERAGVVEQQVARGALAHREPALRRGLEAARRFLERVEIFALAESLGGVESLIEHPAIMTHASLPAEARARLGIGDALVRLSVGIEDAADLIADLDQALG